MKRIIICFFITLSSVACKINKTDDSQNFSIQKNEDLNLSILSHNTVLLSEPTEGIPPITSINKVLIDNSYLFILDARSSPLLYVYNKSGQFITIIGRVGQGPTEYMKIRDFDISEDSIYIYDDRQKRIQVYNLNDFEFSRSVNLQFRARGFSLLENKTMIFASTKDLNKDQIIITDLNGNAKRSFLPFKDNCKDERARSNIFQKNKQEKSISYNRPEDNMLYVLSLDDGAVKDSLDLSRVNRNVYYSTTPIIVKDKIIGNFNSENIKSIYYIDKSNPAKYVYNSREIDPQKQDLKFSELLLPVCNHNNYIISYVSLDMINAFCDLDKCPETITNNLREDGFILSFFEI